MYGVIILENIKKNHELILSKINEIHKASIFSKHKPPKLVAVSKKQEDYKIENALACGQKIFGENRVQEAINRWQKRIDNDLDLELRLIGPLQTNKVKNAIKIFDLFQTLDREKLANEFSKHAESIKNKVFFIQVNIGKEKNKSGILCY